MSTLKFLDVEKTNVFIFVLIHMFVFVIPFFASIMLLADSIQPLYALFSEEQATKVRLAFGKTLVLLAICTLSFLEMFAILSKLFIAFVGTEILLWISLNFGMSYIEYPYQQLDWAFNVPNLAILACLIFKVCVGICMRRKLRFWMKSKTFLKRLGKNV